MKNEYVDQSWDEKYTGTLLNLSSVIENAPYVLSKGGKSIIAGGHSSSDSDSHSTGSSNSQSNSQSHSQSNSRHVQADRQDSYRSLGIGGQCHSHSSCQCHSHSNCDSHAVGIGNLEEVVQ